MRFAETWTPWSVAAIRDLTADIREFTLKPLTGGVAPYAPGSHIGLSLLIDGRPERRTYSLVGDTTDAYRIAVRRAPDSRGGSRAMWALAAGARVDVTTPNALIAIDWTRSGICLIAGGIGVTPMVGIAQALRRRGQNVAMHYAVQARDRAAYLDDLQDCLGQRLHVYAGDEGRRIDFAALFRALAPDALVIVCGPLRMLEAARAAWNAQGRAPSDLRYETFGSSGLLPTEAFSVRVKGSERIIVVPAAMSMLDALNGAGIEVMSDCERGECGVCAIDVIAVEGEIDHRDVFFSDQQKRENRKICPCVSRAVGTVTIDPLYAPDAL